MHYQIGAHKRPRTVKRNKLQEDQTLFIEIHLMYNTLDLD